MKSLCFFTLFISHFDVSFVFPCKQEGERCVKYTIRTAVSSLLSIGYCSLRVGVSWPWLWVKESLQFCPLSNLVDCSTHGASVHSRRENTGPRLVCCLSLNWEAFLPRSFTNNKRCDSSNLTLTSMYISHMDSRLCTLDSHIVITNLLTNQQTYLLTSLLHGAEPVLRS